MIGDLGHSPPFGPVPTPIQLHGEQVERAPSRGVVSPRPDQILSRRMEIRAPIHVLEVVGQRHLHLPIDGNQVQLQHVFFFPVTAEDDPLPVRREEWTAVIAWRIGNLSHFGSVRIHDVNVGVAVPGRSEHDLPTVGRVASLGIVACGIGQPVEPRAIKFDRVEIHMRIEIPLVTPTPPPRRFFAGLQFGHVDLGVGVTGGEENGLTVR